jgi:hypothetical protein
MFTGSLQEKGLRVILYALAILVVSRSLPAETQVGIVVGKIASLRNVSINESAEPTGRVVLSGELVSAKDSPALVTLKDGGDVILTQGAAAVFSRTGNIVSVRADRGTIGFRFLPGREVRLETASLLLASNRNSLNTGELVVGAKSERIMLKSGSLSAVEKSSGREYEVTAATSAQTSQQIAGKGILTQGRNTLTDESQIWPQSLVGKCVIISTEQHKILAVSQTRLTVDGTWALNNGIYDYVITNCAGPASPGAGTGAATEVAKHGMSKGTKVAIGLLAGGGAAGAGGYLATRSKSE